MSAFLIVKPQIDLGGWNTSYKSFFCNPPPAHSILVGRSSLSDFVSAKTVTFSVVASSAQHPLIPWKFLFSLPWRSGCLKACLPRTAYFLPQRGTGDYRAYQVEAHVRGTAGSWRPTDESEYLRNYKREQTISSSL